MSVRDVLCPAPPPYGEVPCTPVDMAGTVIVFAFAAFLALLAVGLFLYLAAAVVEWFDARYDSEETT